jgi:expansin (peptidoglycan-binding protein)
VPPDGPDAAEGSPLVVTDVGPEGTKKAFLDGDGKAFARIANDSMGHGNGQWAILSTK